MSAEVGDFVRYVVRGKTVFSGRLAYTKGRWSGISTRDGQRVDEVLTENVVPSNPKAH